MYRLIKLFLFTVLLTGLLSAASINFGTGVAGGTEGNHIVRSNFPTTFVNFPTIVAPAWHAPIGTSIWESVHVDSLNPPIINGTLVDFYFLFQVVGVPISGTVDILVDDSAEVVFNGTTLINNWGSQQGEHCAATLPNCVTVTTLSLTTLMLSGANRLDVYVEQDAGYQYGLDVFGTATSSGVPEPATYGMLGTGLLGLGLLKRRK